MTIGKNLAISGCLGVALSMAVASLAQAEIKDLPTVGGKGYFLDTATGYVWQDVYNFGVGGGLQKSYDEIQAEIAGTSFQFASRAVVEALFASGDPLDFGTWRNYVGTFPATSITDRTSGFYLPSGCAFRFVGQAELDYTKTSGTVFGPRVLDCNIVRDVRTFTGAWVYSTDPGAIFADAGNDIDAVIGDGQNDAGDGLIIETNLATEHKLDIQLVGTGDPNPLRKTSSAVRTVVLRNADGSADAIRAFFVGKLDGVLTAYDGAFSSVEGIVALKDQGGNILKTERKKVIADSQFGFQTRVDVLEVFGFPYDVDSGTLYQIETTLILEASRTVTGNASAEFFDTFLFELLSEAPPELQTIQVALDIKPGSDPNCFNNDGHGVIPIAILGSAEFDAGAIDDSTLEFEGMAVAVRGQDHVLCHDEDINDDGYQDLVCQFEDVVAVFPPGEGTGTVTGQLLPEFGGTEIEGTDAVCVVPK